MVQISIGSLPPLPILSGSGVPLGSDLIPGVDITQSSNGLTQKYTRAAAFNYELNALGFTTYTAVGVATTTALTATYDNGTLGVGSTLTNAGAQAVLSIDGVTDIVGARVLIKNQASSFQNGIYTVSNIGSASTNWVLVRATDYDQAADIIQYGVMLVVAGTLNAGLLYQETGAGPFIMGTTAITFAAFQAGQISLPVSLANGGSGASLTASNGGILYSNASTGAVLAGTATARQMLQSGASSAPAWSTATWPATTSVSQLLYSSTSNVVTGLATVQGGTLTTNAALAPAWVANPSATGRYLRSVSGDSAAWSTASIADTFAVSTLLYASSLNTVSGLATANDGILVTSATGVPSISNTVGAGLTMPSLTFNDTAGIIGTTTNDDADVGSVGQLVTNVIASGSAVSLTTATPADVTSISLPAGDWDIWANTSFIPAATTNVVQAKSWISATSATQPDASLYAGVQNTAAGIVPADNFGFCVPSIRVSLAATTTYYLSCTSAFAVDTLGVCGGIYARVRR